LPFFHPPVHEKYINHCIISSNCSNTGALSP
jgi:hypothetical protein